MFIKDISNVRNYIGINSSRNKNILQSSLLSFLLNTLLIRVSGYVKGFRVDILRK